MVLTRVPPSLLPQGPPSSPLARLPLPPRLCAAIRPSNLVLVGPRAPLGLNGVREWTGLGLTRGAALPQCVWGRVRVDMVVSVRVCGVCTAVSVCVSAHTGAEAGAWIPPPWVRVPMGARQTGVRPWGLWAAQSCPVPESACPEGGPALHRSRPAVPASFSGALRATQPLSGRWAPLPAQASGAAEPCPSRFRTPRTPCPPPTAQQDKRDQGTWRPERQPLGRQLKLGTGGMRWGGVWPAGPPASSTPTLA